MVRAGHMTAPWALEHFRNYEHCIKHSLWVLKGRHVNCLYNNLVTSTKTPQCNSSSKPLGGKIKCAAWQQGCGPVLLPLLLQQGAFWPEYKPLVTCGLERIKNMKFHVYFSQTSKMFWIYHFRKHKSCKCFRDACFIEKVLRVLYCRWNSGEQDRELEQGSVSMFAERLLLVIFLPQPYFSCICPHASLLGRSCVNVMMWGTITGTVCIPPNPSIRTIFAHKCLHSTWKSFLAKSLIIILTLTFLTKWNYLTSYTSAD